MFLGLSNRTLPLSAMCLFGFAWVEGDRLDSNRHGYEQYIVQYNLYSTILLHVAGDAFQNVETRGTSSTMPVFFVVNFKRMHILNIITYSKILLIYRV